MADWVGVTGPLYVAKTLKPQLLLFDRIAYPGVDAATMALRRPYFAAFGFANELTALRDAGIVFDPFVGQVPLSSGLAATMDEIERRREEARHVVSAVEGGALSHVEALQKLDSMTFDAQRMTARIFATVAREFLRLDGIPLCTESELPEAGLALQRRVEVLQVVVRQLPIPGDQHSLDDVLAFRDEARSQGLVSGLRVWMNDVAAGGLTGVEVSEKLEHLVSEYDRALKLERMARRTSAVEAVIVTTVEIAESLVKFQWSKLAKKLFDVKRKKIELMKTEMGLPGREVAYIVKARERFRHDPS